MILVIQILYEDADLPSSFMGMLMVDVDMLEQLNGQDLVNLDTSKWNEKDV